MAPTPHSELDAVFHALPNNDAHALDTLARLVACLRPAKPELRDQAVMNLRALCFQLQRRADYRQSLRNALLALMSETRQLPLYTECGILANAGFFPTLIQRIGERLLPMPYSENSLQDRFGKLFERKDDHLWLAAIPDAVWIELWQALAWQEEEQRETWRQTRLQLLEAVQVLAARVAAIGLEPELVRINPDIERFESPFLHLNAEVLRYAESQRQALCDIDAQADDEKHILVLLDQCEAILAKVRKNASRYGISVDLTYQALRLAQNIERLRALLALLDQERDAAADPALFRLIVAFARAENRKYSLRDLFQSNTELLALQVTEHAGRQGDHYIAETRQEWQAMAKAAMGAGFIVGFMALIKILIARAHLPLLWEGLGFGLNYAFGFILIQVLHFTVATKQPAMTAARIAAALQQQGNKVDLQQLADLVVQVMRTQFIAIVGNVLLAMPTAALLAFAWQYLLGEPLAGPAKTQTMLHELDPLHSLALFHAAIAGVYLFLSGLIAGYYDNRAIYRRIPERLAGHPLLQKLLGQHRAWKLGQYVEGNLGALAGNFYFGLFLGLTGTIGTILGLPLDIRHITFSASNLATAAVSTHFQLPLATAIACAAGVALIGLINLTVSFCLALWVALRSRKLSGRQVLPLAPLLLRRLLTSPRQFFWPPKESMSSSIRS